MNKYLLPKLLFVLCFFWSTYAMAQWSYVNTGTMYSFYGLSVNGTNVFLGGTGNIMVSNNNGGTWATRNVVDLTNNTLAASSMYGLHFFNATVGVGTGIIASGNSETLLRTTNGGSNWAVANYYNGGSLLRYLNDIYFVDASTGYAAGTNGRILKTIDGGVSWASVSSGTIEWKSIWFTSANTGFVVGNNSIMRTTNGGTSWSNTTVVGGLVSVSFGNSLVGYASGSGVVYKTTDGGDSWNQLTDPFTNTGALYAVNTDTVYMAANQSLAITRDGGVSWETFTYLNNQTLNNVLFTDETHGWACGNLGALFKTSNGGGATVPVSYFTYSISNACGYSILHLNNQGGPSNTYKWYVNGILHSTNYNTEDTVTSTGSVLIKLVTFNGTDSAVITQTINIPVIQPITANAGVDVSVCFGNSNTLQGAGGSHYVWSPTTGLSNPSIANPEVLTDTTTTFILTVSDATSTCFDSDSVTIYFADSIHGLPWISTAYASTRRAMSVDFVNPNIGFVSGSNDYNLYKTRDGGESWTTYTFPICGFFSELDFVDENIGYVAQRLVYKTTDGGQSFTVVTYAGSDDYDRLCFTDALCGYVASWSSGKIIRTIDGGNTWSQVASTVGVINRIFCLNKDTCFCVTGNGVSDGRIYRTTNGSTWVNVTPVGITPPGTQDVFFVNDTLGYAGILKTTDMGATWIQMPISNPRSISFVNQDTGFASVNNGHLFQTVNGGQCWQDMGFTLQATEEFQFLSSGVGFFAGGGITLSSGNVFKTIPGYNLDFSCHESTLCTGGTLNITNNSFGFDYYYWYLNGVLVDSTLHPTLSIASAGINQVTLIGWNGIFSDTLIQTVNADIPGTFSITQHPASLVICEEGQAQFNCQASGPGATYKWQLLRPGMVDYVDIIQNANFSDPTLPTININGLPIVYSGTTFRCVIDGCTASNTATLTMRPRVVITTELSNRFRCASTSSDTYFINASGTGLTYQWRVNDGTGYVDLYNNFLYSGTQTSTLVLADILVSLDHYQYQCVVTDSCGFTDSTSMTLVVSSNEPPLILGADSIYACLGDTVLLEMQPYDIDNTYRWKRNGSFVSGANEHTLKVITTGEYRGCLDNYCFSSWEESQIVYVLFGVIYPEIIYPYPPTACDGDSIPLQASPGGAGFSYQWFLDGVSIPGAIYQDYWATENGDYTVAVSSACATGTTYPITGTILSVPPTPTIIQSGNVLSSDATTGNQWYNASGPILGAISQTYVPALSGSYYTIVTHNDCSSLPSNIINYSTGGIFETNWPDDILLYPSPVIDQLMLFIPQKYDAASVEIWSENGQCVYKAKGKEEFMMSLGHLASGVYTIQLDFQKTLFRKSIIKQ